ncbi:MAG: hypothetical protein U1E27_04230 [Kiritimatiellia bacterium]|nr:hypothetical protein [Kiritimatiellia bacterium]
MKDQFKFALPIAFLIWVAIGLVPIRGETWTAEDFLWPLSLPAYVLFWGVIPYVTSHAIVRIARIPYWLSPILLLLMIGSFIVLMYRSGSAEFSPDGVHKEIMIVSLQMWILTLPFGIPWVAAFYFRPYMTPKITGLCHLRLAWITTALSFALLPGHFLPEHFWDSRPISMRIFLASIFLQILIFIFLLRDGKKRGVLPLCLSALAAFLHCVLYTRL